MADGPQYGFRTIQVSDDLHARLTKLKVDYGKKRIEEVIEFALNETQSGIEAGEIKPPEEHLPPYLRLLWEVCDEPHDAYEEILRNRIFSEVEALKDWRKKESRRASGPP